MRISFVIPFHNEERNVRPMLDQVSTYARSQKWEYEIIPVNDRSTDNTQKVLGEYAKKDKRIKPLERKHDREALGNTMGLSLKIGTNKASGDIVIWTMGDRSDDSTTYGHIVTKIIEGYDMVFGSRYMSGGSRGSLDAIKAFLSSNGTKLAQLFFGVPVHDITNAFRGFRKEVFQRIVIESNDFAISPEFAVKAHLAGFRLGEVPTIYTRRFEGASSFKIIKMSLAYIVVYFRCLLRLTPITK